MATKHIITLEINAPMDEAELEEWLSELITEARLHLVGEESIEIVDTVSTNDA